MNFLYAQYRKFPLAEKHLKLSPLVITHCVEKMKMGGYLTEAFSELEAKIGHEMILKPEQKLAVLSSLEKKDVLYGVPTVSKFSCFSQPSAIVISVRCS